LPPEKPETRGQKSGVSFTEGSEDNEEGDLSSIQFPSRSSVEIPKQMSNTHHPYSCSFVVEKGQTCARNTRKVAKRNSIKGKTFAPASLPALWGTWIGPALFRSKCWDDGKANRPEAQISGGRAAFFRQRVETRLHRYAKHCG